jgi:hypothetical protein
VRTWQRYRDIARRTDADEAVALHARGAARDNRDRRRSLQRSIERRRGVAPPEQRAYDLARHEACPAGTVAGMFLPSFVPHR